MFYEYYINDLHLYFLSLNHVILVNVINSSQVIFLLSNYNILSLLSPNTETNKTSAVRKPHEINLSFRREWVSRKSVLEAPSQSPRVRQVHHGMGKGLHGLQVGAADARRLLHGVPDFGKRALVSDDLQKWSAQESYVHGLCFLLAIVSQHLHTTCTWIYWRKHLSLMHI